MRASMPLTHQYLLNIVEEAGGLNEERLAWFYQRYIKSEQVKYTPELASVIKQLHYLGKIEKRGRYWCRPWHEPDYTLLRCLDVMMALAYSMAGWRNLSAGRLFEHVLPDAGYSRTVCQT